MRAFRVLLALFSAALSLPAWAQDPRDADPASRAAFEAELRAAILANGDVISEALAGMQPEQSEMRQHIEDDLNLLDRLAPQLLAGRDLALFTSADCAECPSALTELKILSDTYGVTFIQHDMADPQAANWSALLGLDEAPFYVLPTMILRGHMPAVVLEKYLLRAKRAAAD